MFRARLACLAALIALLLCPVLRADPQRWAHDIDRLTAHDADHPPAPGGVLFVGSSSIRKWDTTKWFPHMNVINRGFGGSEIADSIYYFDRIVATYKPRAIVFYAGDNDIAAKKTPQQVYDDYQRFASLVHEKLPQTKLIFIAIKPSVARWKLADKMAQANEMIRAACKKDDKAVYVDVWPPMLGDDGQPRKDLFVHDGLHMNDTGYAIWVKMVMPLVEKPNDK